MALKVSGAIRTTKPLAQLLQKEFDHTITTEKILFYIHEKLF